MTNWKHLTQEDLDMAKKGIFNREIESFQKVAKNNVIVNDVVKEKIDKTQ